MVISAGDLILNHTSFYSAGTRNASCIAKSAIRLSAGTSPPTRDRFGDRLTELPIPVMRSKS